MNEILKELSWPLKLKVLNELPGSKDKQLGKPSTAELPATSYRDVTPLPPLPPVPPLASLTTPPADEINQTSVLPNSGITAEIEEEPPKLLVLEKEEEARRVGVERLTAARQDEGQPGGNDDNDMRLKLFRLMYETVRDSDLKVKRAELIKEHYVNSTTFEIGYLVGDITDKASIISDISMTLKRFYTEWKPIEHINAYEQIANQAIEIAHLIDLVRIVNKHDKENGGQGPSFIF